MPDKKSINEAIALIRKQKRIMRKSLAGVGRVFDYDSKPQMALTSREGTAVMNAAPKPKPKLTTYTNPRTKRTSAVMVI
jgi:hypothetical protein